MIWRIKINEKIIDKYLHNICKFQIALSEVTII